MTKTIRGSGALSRGLGQGLLLADSSRRYVFITNSSVDSGLAKGGGGRVRYPEQNADAAFTPTNSNLQAAGAAKPRRPVRPD